MSTFHYDLGIRFVAKSNRVMSDSHNARTWYSASKQPTSYFTFSHSSPILCTLRTNDIKTRQCHRTLYLVLMNAFYMSLGNPIRSTYRLTTTFELAPQLVGPCWQKKPTLLTLATDLISLTKSNPLLFWSEAKSGLFPEDCTLRGLLST